MSEPPTFKTAADALMFCISVEIALRDYYYELIERADEITARIDHEAHPPDELKRFTGE